MGHVGVGWGGSCKGRGGGGVGWVYPFGRHAAPMVVSFVFFKRRHKESYWGECT